MPTGHTPHQTPRHAPVQPHMGPNGPPHYDDHRMQYSASQSSVQPSPRPMPPYAYNNQGPQPMQMYAQPMPGYGMSPGGGHPMNMRQVSSGGSQYMQPNGPQMGGHVMTNQHSSGPYMNAQMNPQMPMFSPSPNQVYPHHNGPMPPQAANGGYPSPRPAPMMVHQGSQQGHPQQMMYMAPGQHGPGVYPQAPSGPSKFVFSRDL
jgi:hypothetical protein